MPDKLASWISTYGRIVTWILMAIVAIAGFMAAEQLRPLVNDIKNFKVEVAAKYVTRDQADDLYMHRDVSESRWKANDEAHADIKNGIGDIKTTLKDMQIQLYQRNANR